MIDEIPIPSEQVKLFFMNLPFSKFLGLKLSRLGDGKAVMILNYRKDLVGDPKTGVLHGGVITTLLAMCYKVTNSVVFVKASAQDGTKKTPVATATGAFTSPF